MFPQLEHLRQEAALCGGTVWLIMGRIFGMSSQGEGGPHGLEGDKGGSFSDDIKAHLGSICKMPNNEIKL